MQQEDRRLTEEFLRDADLSVRSMNLLLRSGIQFASEINLDVLKEDKKNFGITSAREIMSWVDRGCPSVRRRRLSGVGHVNAESRGRMITPKDIYLADIGTPARKTLLGLRIKNTSEIEIDALLKWRGCGIMTSKQIIDWVNVGCPCVTVEERPWLRTTVEKIGSWEAYEERFIDGRELPCR